MLYLSSMIFKCLVVKEQAGWTIEWVIFELSKIFPYSSIWKAIDIVNLALFCLNFNIFSLISSGKNVIFLWIKL